MACAEVIERRNTAEMTMVGDDDSRWLVLVCMETPLSFVENSG